METNSQTSGEEFSLEIFNVSQETDDIEIKLDESFEMMSSEVGRRC
jgi:hypothetical protein